MDVKTASFETTAKSDSTVWHYLGINLKKYSLSIEFNCPTMMIQIPMSTNCIFKMLEFCIEILYTLTDILYRIGRFQSYVLIHNEETARNIKINDISFESTIISPLFR